MRDEPRRRHRYLHGEKVAFGLLVQLVLEGRPSGELRTVLGFAREVGLPTMGGVGVQVGCCGCWRPYYSDSP